MLFNLYKKRPTLGGRSYKELIKSVWWVFFTFQLAKGLLWILVIYLGFDFLNFFRSFFSG